jgi:hypothetical protein
VGASCSLQGLFPASQRRSKLLSPVESLQCHFIHAMSHWSSGLPVCFLSQGIRVQIPRGYLCETGILLLALSCYSLVKLTHSSPSDRFRPDKIANFLSLSNHVCALLKVDTAIGLYLCFQLQKQKLFSTYTSHFKSFQSSKT